MAVCCVVDVSDIITVYILKPNGLGGVGIAQSV